MKPTYQVQLKIRKPAAEVFDAVVRPEKLSRYFVAAASAPLVAGTTVKWRFAEVPGEHDVIVREVAENQRIVLEWDAPSGDHLIQVRMEFHPLDTGDTMVRISESGWRDTPEEREASHGNAGGWMHMMCCLKAYLEYGVNLRAGGAF
ncbi:SRPBCC domain-containing protein [Rhodoligotrophos defluvii]|uniref:SRPBCC domain-containing protein n=1 Tax=Rhodoligotrophos defluvii TaxID=2561934 RepID=UPI0010C9B049|nr:SRPBCC domain-containing protein [Rhodoligotrophos defluvii]